MKVELVYFTGCPHVEAARRAIRDALSAAGLPPCWQEWNSDDAATPDALRGYGSPTVLVNGRDVAPMQTDADCCRVYSNGKGILGTPEADVIRAALESGSKDNKIGGRA